MSTTLMAGWLPGLPHVLYGEKSPQWLALRKGCERLAEDIAKASPDLLVLYSTGWLSVLGTSFQTHPNPKGLHVDENWYELGDLPFDFRTDAQMGERFAKAVREEGMPTKTVCFDEFPIDTGTIVAMRLLNDRLRIPVSIVSAWVYADPEKSRAIGRAMRETVARSGKKAVFLASSGLTARFFTEDIDPTSDRISSPEDDAWNRKFLGLVEAGKIAEASREAAELARRAPVDMQLSAFHWLSGVLGDEPASGRILAYGPVWGTGAAVMEFTK